MPIEHTLGKNLDVSKDALQSLTIDEQLNYLKEQLQKVNLLSPSAGVTQVRGQIEVWKASFLQLVQETSRTFLC